MGISLDHIRGLFQRLGCFRYSPQRRWHVLLEDGIVAVVDSLMSNLYKDDKTLLNIRAENYGEKRYTVLTRTRFSTAVLTARTGFSRSGYKSKYNKAIKGYRFYKPQLSPLTMAPPSSASSCRITKRETCKQEPKIQNYGQLLSLFCHDYTTVKVCSDSFMRSLKVYEVAKRERYPRRSVKANKPSGANSGVVDDTLQLFNQPW